MKDLKYLYIQILALFAPFAFLFLFCPTIYIATFGWFSLEFIKIEMHLLGHFCALTLLFFLLVFFSL